MVSWATSDLTAVTLARQFYDNVVCVYGPPKVLISDNGRSFVSKFFQSLSKCLQIKRIFTCHYRPQSNGQAERAQRSIIQLLRTYVQKHQKDWDEHLQGVVFALNTTSAFCYRSFTPSTSLWSQSRTTFHS